MHAVSTPEVVRNISKSVHQAAHARVTTDVSTSIALESPKKVPLPKKQPVQKLHKKRTKLKQQPSSVSAPLDHSLTTTPKLSSSHLVQPPTRSLVIKEPSNTPYNKLADQVTDFFILL